MARWTLLKNFFFSAPVFKIHAMQALLRGSRKRSRRGLLLSHRLATAEVCETRTLLAGITVDDSGGADFTTIQAAVNAASAGDVITVNDGTYNETVNLNLMGSAVAGTPGDLIIQAANSRQAFWNDAGDALTANGISGNFTIQGFDIGTATVTNVTGLVTFSDNQFDALNGESGVSASVTGTTDMGVHVIDSDFSSAGFNLLGAISAQMGTSAGGSLDLVVDQNNFTGLQQDGISVNNQDQTALGAGTLTARITDNTFSGRTSNGDEIGMFLGGNNSNGFFASVLIDGNQTNIGSTPGSFDDAIAIDIDGTNTTAYVAVTDNNLNHHDDGMFFDADSTFISGLYNVLIDGNTLDDISAEGIHIRPFSDPAGDPAVWNFLVTGNTLTGINSDLSTGHGGIEIEVDNTSNDDYTLNLDLNGNSVSMAAGSPSSSYVVDANSTSNATVNIERDIAANNTGTVSIDDPGLIVTMPSANAVTDNNEVRTVSGFIFNDSNGDGDQTGEAGVGGVLVTLTGTQSAGGAISLTTFTDINGNYAFPSVVQPDGSGYTLTVATTTDLGFYTLQDAVADNIDSDVDQMTGQFTVAFVGAGAAVDVDAGMSATEVSATIPVNLSVDTNSATEAAGTVITVTATADSAVSGDQTVELGVSGTGITAGDFTLSDTTITILDGLTSGSVTFTIADDGEIELTETATLTISNPSAGLELGSTITQNVTITDNDLTATLLVDIATDENDGDFSAGDLSLREAIILANSNADANTITFDAALDGTDLVLSLTGTGEDASATGDLDITTEIVIQGNGAGNTVINADGIDRVFEVDYFSDLSLNNLTITGGNVIGGGVLNHGILTVTSSAISGNTGFRGAGIYNQGEATITDSIISGNTSEEAGGGIFNGTTYTDSLTVTNSTISGNVSQTGRGGGIAGLRGTTLIVNSAISGNTSESYGGGISTGVLPTRIINSTISGNSSEMGPGGGIAVTLGTAEIINSTISGNSADMGSGGGIYNGGKAYITNSTVTGNSSQTGGGFYAAAGYLEVLNNTIIVGNTAGSSTDVGGSVDTANNNLIGVAGGGISDGIDGNIVGADVSDVLDTTLADNGGPTLTHALVTGSLAIDAGDNALAVDADMNPLTTDQRGTGIDRIVNGTVDIGAYEAAISDLSVVITDNPDPIATGASTNYTIVLTNNGPAAVTGVTLNNVISFPGGGASGNIVGTNFSGAGAFTSIQLDGNGPNVNGISLASGETLTVTMNVSADTGSGPMTLTSTAQNGTPADDDNANDSDSEETFVVPETILVDIATDENDGDYSAGDLSLREAIILANSNADANTITFDAALDGTDLLLTMGEMDITADVTITGNGVAETAIDAQQNSRIFDIAMTAGDITIDGVTLRDGQTTGVGSAGDGGAIHSDSTGTLTINNSVLSGNSTDRTAADGGAIHHQGQINITGSTFTENYSIDGYGGAITTFGEITITNSTFSNNSTSGNSNPGGAIAAFGDVTVTNSTLSENVTSGTLSNGGAIYSSNRVTIINSTLSGNSTANTESNGGAIYSYQDFISTNSTIVGNFTTAGNSNAGAIFVGGGRNATISNSIIAGNSAGGSNPEIQVSGSLSIENSIIGDNAGTGLTESQTPDANGNFIGTSANPIDPLLGALADNGGPTFTHALLAGSIALDAGDDALAVDGDMNALTTDQRGFRRSFDASVDIGAFEAVSETLLVDIATDENDGDFSAGDLSLREAIILANSNADANTITFDAALDGTELLLTLGEFDITEDVVIMGNGSANTVIDAQQNSRIFDIALGIVTIDGVTLQNGQTTATNSSGNGGAIRSASNALLTINDSVLTGNSTTGSGADGGAIHHRGQLSVTGSTFIGNDTLSGYGGAILTFDDITITNSTLSGNTTDGSLNAGGAIASGGNVTVINSTLSGNSTSGSSSEGGAIYSARDITVINSTISGNSTSGSSSDGGAIYGRQNVSVINSTIVGNFTEAGDANAGGIYARGGGNITISNSIVANNTAGGTNPDVLSTGTLTVEHSIIGDNAGTGLTESQTADVNGNFIGSSAGGGVIDPMLGALADNGGPTQTHALLDGSLAIDAGSDALAVDADMNPLTTDQRGFRRIFGTSVDIGAVEAIPETLLVDIATDENDGDFSAGDLSLREAIILANSNADANTITFDAALDGTDLLLTLSGSGDELGDLDITTEITILGNGADQTRIDAGGNTGLGDRIFHVLSGANFTLDSVSVVGGRGDGGGGIRVENGAIAEIISSAITGNNIGGGLSNQGTLTVRQSLISGNTTLGNGGGIWNFGNSAILNVINSSISRNDANYFGGGIANQNNAVATVINSTVIRNSNDYQGSGIYNQSDFTLTNSIVAGNTYFGAASDIGGNITIANNNLIGDAGSSGGITHGMNGNIVGNAGTGTLDINTILDTNLADNGGPTFTHALVTGSVAIDNGDDTLATNAGLTTDQRGSTRFFDTVDIGAFEVIPETLLVDIATDENDGDYSAGDLSLREAIILANSNVDANTITFAAGLNGTPIVLTMTGAEDDDSSAGDLDITTEITIDGEGQEITIDGGSDLASGGMNAGIGERVLEVLGSGDLTLEGIQITGGNASNQGGGLRIAAGAVATVTNSTISGNRANFGGGIYTYQGSATIITSTISDNQGQIGGGIRINEGFATITNSTISGNQASISGGGINIEEGSATITNSTISGNQADFGGGIYNRFGSAAITNSTISGNQANFHGGVYNNGVVTLNNTIVANSVGGDIGNAGTLNGSFNLIEDGQNLGNLTDTITGDPNLGALADNGGPTMTHALLTGSVAIDNGDDTLATNAGLTTDQRGSTRFFDTVDIGAFEVIPETLLVDIATDENDGDYSAGDLSLREAIILANMNADANTIVFDSGLDGTPIVLSLIDFPNDDSSAGDLDITSEITIDGEGQDITIDGGSDRASGGINSGINDRVLHVLIDGNLTLEGIQITGSNAGTFGGGVYNQGVVTITNSTISGNYSSLSGGGVFNSDSGTATITSSTISGNQAYESGGGVHNRGVVTITNSTISRNQASLGGGVFNSTGSMTLNNTIVAGSLSGDDVDNRDTLTGSNNLIQDGSGGLVGSNGNIQGDPMLGALADNGGPTFTHALLDGSLAINAGSNALAVDADMNPLTTDQRGSGFDRFFGTVDIGAFEAQPPAMNNAVVNSLPGELLTVLTNGSLVFSTANGNGISISDNDNYADQPYRVTLDVPAGSITLATTMGLTDITGDGSASVQFTGNLTDINNALDGLTYDAGAVETLLDLTILTEELGTPESDTDTQSIRVVASLTEAALDFTTFSGEDKFSTSNTMTVFGDEFIEVDSSQSYTLSGFGQSGDGAGGLLGGNNRQFLGLASYDADQLLIRPWHVNQFAGSALSRLTQDLQNGETVIHLDDVSGWNNGGGGHERTLAWYGYENSFDETYEDYTYTRNVLFDRNDGAWDVGMIDFVNNTITLRNAWTGGTLRSGTAMSNNTAGDTYNYIGAHAASVGDDWTAYSGMISGVGSGSHQFREGTEYVRTVLLTNRGAGTGNQINWRDIEFGRTSGTYLAGDRIELRVAEVAGATYEWMQTDGPAVMLDATNTAVTSFEAPKSETDYSVTFSVTIDDGTPDVEQITLNIGQNPLALSDGATAALDFTTFDGDEEFSTTAHSTKLGDDFIAVDTSQSYTLSGSARSGDGMGNDFVANNRQFFGLASYDADQLLIRPWHVNQVPGSAQARLTQELQNGDTVIHLDDVSGWMNAGGGHERTLAWYGFEDSFGQTYDDYTYTRNVLFDSTNGAWDAGMIDFENNTITLRNVWSGGDITVGTAFSNNTAGDAYKYPGARGVTIGNTWTEYTGTISGVGEGPNQFRHGTAFVKTILLTNRLRTGNNLVNWRDIEFGRTSGTYLAGDQVDLQVDQISRATYAWRQLSGPMVSINNANSYLANFTAPNSPTDFTLEFEVTVETGNQIMTEIVELDFLGLPA